MTHTVRVLAVRENLTPRANLRYRVLVHIIYDDGTSEEFWRACAAPDELGAMVETERYYRS